jgi:Protein of unknown function (DUF2721)
MCERLKQAVLKTALPEKVTGVRIPLPPPFVFSRMANTFMGADPFSILTVVVAPAVLTNASSVLALGTNNRLARVADRSHAVTAQLANIELGARGHEACTAELISLQTRAQLLLRALRCFYLGLGLFASSALISIAGSIVMSYGPASSFQVAAGIGVVCGASAVIALVCGCLLMIRETRLAVKGLALEAKSHSG